MSDKDTGNPKKLLIVEEQESACLNSHFRASSALKSLYVMAPNDLDVWIAITQTTDYIHVSSYSKSSIDVSQPEQQEGKSSDCIQSRKERIC